MSEALFCDTGRVDKAEHGVAGAQLTDALGSSDLPL